MAKTKSKIEFTRVNMNLPTDLVERVKEYSESIGINTTSGYIVLLNQALDQKQTLNNLPQLTHMLQDFQSALNQDNSNRKELF